MEDTDEGSLNANVPVKSGMKTKKIQQACQSKIPDSIGLSRSRNISRLHGPILVLGASGFVGANLFRALSAFRDDVYGTASRLPAWRLE